MLAAVASVTVEPASAHAVATLVEAHEVAAHEVAVHEVAAVACITVHTVTMPVEGGEMASDLHFLLKLFAYAAKKCFICRMKVKISDVNG